MMRRIGVFVQAGLIAALAVCFCGCGARAYRVVLEPPLPVEHNETLVDLAEPIDLGRFSLVRAPEHWKVSLVRYSIYEDSKEPYRAILQIDREGYEPVECWFNLIPTGYYAQELSGEWPLGAMFRDYPEVTFIDFIEMFSSDYDLAMAWSIMQPGDASKGERRLNRREQTECMLAHLCVYDFSNHIPVHLQLGGFSAFIGGRIMRTQPIASMWLIPDKSYDRITVWFLKGLDEPGPYETNDALATVASTFAEGLALTKDDDGRAIDNLLSNEEIRQLLILGRISSQHAAELWWKLRRCEGSEGGQCE